jgi:hypothetical protein
MQVAKAKLSKFEANKKRNNSSSSSKTDEKNREETSAEMVNGAR